MVVTARAAYLEVVLWTSFPPRDTTVLTPEGR
jgi:hypothetical protein